MQRPFLRHVSVTGFQGDRSFEFYLNSDVNFLFGRNGTGKTTLINVINAGLSGDINTLASMRFSTLSLTLEDDHQDILRFLYSRHYLKDSGSIGIQMSLYDRNDVEFAGQTFRQGTGSSWNIFSESTTDDPQIHWRRFLRENGVSAPLLTWLNIHRGEHKSGGFSGPVQAPIDKRLDELANRATRYLSLLDSRATNASLSFQKSAFLALLSYNHDRTLKSIYNRLKRIHLPTEEHAVEEIFSHIGLSEEQYSDRLSSHFKRANALVEANTTPRLSISNVLALVDTIRVHELVEQWQSLQDQVGTIYQPKDEFIDLISNLFLNKYFLFDEQNSPKFVQRDGETLDIHDLSSGEKHIFIILAEALLQEGRRTIYIADEPELSLHVAWQEALVPSLKKLNPAAQVIFATHSPDVIGPFSTQAINLETL